MSNRLSYNIRQASNETGLPYGTLLAWHQAKKLPGSRKAGRIVIIPAETLEALVRGDLDWQKPKEEVADGERLQEA